jgi:predicted permease
MIAIAVLSLALGIGANSAIVSILDALMLRALPISDPDTLVVATRNFARGSANAVSYPTFERLRDSGLFASVAATVVVDRLGVRTTGPGGDLGTVHIGLVSGAYFTTFGVHAALGRVLGSEDDNHPVGVVSAAGWQRLFGSAPNVVGRTLTVGSTTFTVVGCVAGPFGGEEIGQATDVWVPVTLEPQVLPERPGLLQSPGANWIRVIARLRPGMSRQAAERDAATLYAATATASASFGMPKLTLEPAGRGFATARASLATPLEVVAVIVSLVLLVACANVAMLLLARAEGRRREIAVRLAIGARRERLVRQLLAESGLLAAWAGAAGFGVASWTTGALVALAGSGRAPFTLDVRPDARMLGITAGVSLATALLFGLLPAWRGTRRSVVGDLNGVSQAVRARLWGGKVVVAAQVATSIVLLVAAGLFVRTLANLEHTDTGFDRDRVWMFWMSPIEAGRQGAALVPLFAAASDRVATLPGVVSVSPSTDGVLSGFIGLRTVTAEGYRPGPGEDTNAQWNLVGPRFFATLGMKLLAGRDFGPHDTAHAPLVAVVNETMARRFFPGTDPMGKRFAFGQDVTQLIEVVGVVSDAKYFSLREDPTPMVFLPYQQDAAHIFRMCVVVRVGEATPGLLTEIRETLGTIDPGVPVGRVNSASDQLDRTLADERLVAWLGGGFSLLALLLAAIGLYGVMSFAVARRTREIGIRSALGASRASILGRVLTESLACVGVGVAIGVPASVLLTRSVAALLFGVTPTDPVTVLTAILTLASVATAAALVPALRASAIDPVIALRTE